MGMTLIRFALVAVVVLVLFEGVELQLPSGVELQSCQDRNHRKNYPPLVEKMSCSAPQETIVELPVPSGFAYVTPVAVKMKRCSGLHCDITINEKCHPTSTTKRTYPVEAYTDIKSKPQCRTVTMDEHNDCTCDCNETQCEEGYKFDTNSCQCVCDPDHSEMKDCYQRRNIENITVMWSVNNCKCECDNTKSKEKCPSDVWNDYTCSCGEHSDNEM